MTNRTILAPVAVALLVVVTAACGTDGTSSNNTDPPATAPPAPAPTSPVTTSPAPPPAPTPAPVTAPTTAPTSPTTAPDSGGGGHAQAGAPRFDSFTVSSPVPCQDGNATATMSFATENVDEIEIKIGTGKFQTTAGYGPDESSVVASIPCTGAGQSSIQLRGCTSGGDCATSDTQPVTITG